MSVDMEMDPQREAEQARVQAVESLKRARELVDRSRALFVRQALDGGVAQDIGPDDPTVLMIRPAPDAPAAPTA
jgi:hypothetical protein